MSHIMNTTAMRALIGRIPDTSISDRLRLLLQRIETEASGILKVMQSPDPDKSSMAIDRILNDERGRMRDVIAKTRAEALPMIENWRAQQDAARVAKAQLKQDSYAAEVRLVFRGLEYAQKLQFMANITAKSDGALAAALLDAPAELTGLNSEQAEQFRNSFLDRSSKSAEPVADEMLAVVTTFLGEADRFAAPDGAAKRTGNQPGVIVQPQPA